MVRDFKESDVAKICDIYNYYIRETIISFEEIELTEEEMLQRIPVILENYPWIVYEETDEIIGYAYATKWNNRSAYRNTIETTIYIDPNHTGRGIGRKLYKTLLSKLKSLPIHCALGVIALLNEASIKLHKALGYEKVGHFKEVGFKFGKLVDVEYWQIKFEDT